MRAAAKSIITGAVAVLAAAPAAMSMSLVASPTLFDRVRPKRNPGVAAAAICAIISLIALLTPDRAMPSSILMPPTSVLLAAVVDQSVTALLVISTIPFRSPRMISLCL